MNVSSMNRSLSLCRLFYGSRNHVFMQSPPSSLPLSQAEAIQVGCAHRDILVQSGRVGGARDGIGSAVLTSSSLVARLKLVVTLLVVACTC